MTKAIARRLRQTILRTDRIQASLLAGDLSFLDARLQTKHEVEATLNDVARSLIRPAIRSLVRTIIRERVR